MIGPRALDLSREVSNFEMVVCVICWYTCTCICVICVKIHLYANVLVHTTYVHVYIYSKKIASFRLLRFPGVI